MTVASYGSHWLAGWTGEVVVPPSVTLVSISRTRVSRIPGWDSTEIVWSSDKDFTGYQFRVVASGTDPVTQGTQIEANQNPPAGDIAGTQYTSTLTDDEIVAASPADGDKVVKLFLENAGGWSS